MKTKPLGVTYYVYLLNGMPTIVTEELSNVALSNYNDASDGLKFSTSSFARANEYVSTLGSPSALKHFNKKVQEGLP